MPGSGVNLLWDETSPADAANAGAGAGVIRSLETSMRNALAVEHNWPTATGPNFGYHLFGSCRPFYDVQSNVSSAGTDARLLLTSDTSRLFAVGSGGTVLLGDTNLLSVGTTTGISRPQRAYWAIEFGQATSDANGRVLVTFPNSGFSGAPFVLGQVIGAPTIRTMDFLLDNATTASTFSGTIVDSVDGLKPNFKMNWFSIGTRTL